MTLLFDRSVSLLESEAEIIFKAQQTTSSESSSLIKRKRFGSDEVVDLPHIHFAPEQGELGPEGIFIYSQNKNSGFSLLVEDLHLEVK